MINNHPGYSPGQEVGGKSTIARGVVSGLLQLLQLPDEPLPQDPVLDLDVVLDLNVRQLHNWKLSYVSSDRIVESKSESDT